MGIARDLKRKLNRILHTMAKDPSDFVRRPGVDFSRKRLLDFETMMKMLITFGGQTLRKELFSALKNEIGELPSASAFTQQRQKILPEAFEHAMKEFNEATLQLNRSDPEWHDYRIIAADGTDLNIAYNEASETFTPNSIKKGFNQFHLTALYDITNSVYLDAIIEPKNRFNEHRAAGEMMKRSAPKRSILLADRAYGSLNLIQTLRKAKRSFVIRVKNDFVFEIENMPMAEWDQVFCLKITTSQDKFARAQGVARKAHFLPGKSKSGKPKKDVSWDFEDGELVVFRAVRFQLPGGTWETLVTDLNSAAFSLSMLKKLYHLRWGIETSFRDLKYTIGLTHFHTRNEECVKQEIFARLLMYNFAERVVADVVVHQRQGNIYEYHVEFSTVAYIIRDFLRTAKDPPDDTLEHLLSRYTVPYRPGRHDKRKLIPKGVIMFMYRVA